MQKTNSIIIFIVLSLIIVGCSGKKKEVKTIPLQSNDMSMSHGFNLLESNCFSCHTINPNSKDLVAPSMKIIKEAYLTSNVSSEEFSKSITDFIQNPSKENSIMHSAIESFGLMPKMDFSETQLKLITTYLFQTNIEEEGWYENYYQKEKAKHSKINSNSSPLEKGLEYAMKTKAILGKNLLNAIKTKGTVDALSFCNENAIHLTDSVANQMNFKIKRVSDKNRNPINKANINELTYIENAKNQLIHAKKITPQIQEINDEFVGYYPITTNKMCLQCHGNPSTEIQQNALLKIKELYPNDMAIGYNSNELRGIWVVTMPIK